MIPIIIKTSDTAGADVLLPAGVSTKHPDVLVITDHLISTYRQAIRYASNPPVSLKVKYLIFTNAQDSSTIVQAALLKTLEDSPPWLQIGLITNSLTSLLPTVISRCLIKHIDLETKTASSDLPKLESISEIISFAATSGKDKAKAISTLTSLILNLRNQLLVSPDASLALHLDHASQNLEAIEGNVNPVLALEDILFTLFSGNK
jgi:DNA polymerase III delta prime subunit